ncbi:seminal metalloprotease 1-like [Lucilia cuprina]|uniref:seminal metalloprotease 1-like n=1 Tax=Lucilia cuprina TaxID=7375 RepID=UPI001F05BF77|nr:seminal metalloprotease 1-like [Lucilia cuprina]
MEVNIILVILFLILVNYHKLSVKAEIHQDDTELTVELFKGIKEVPEQTTLNVDDNELYDGKISEKTEKVEDNLELTLDKEVPLEADSTEDDPELTAGFYEGDMEVDLTRNGAVGAAKRWPNGVVRFKIGPVFDVNHTLYILEAMKTIESVSCIRFRHALPTTKAYIQIRKGTGCSAFVGYTGKAQNVNLRVDPLDKGCFRKGSIMHELLHSLGFYHQHKASDRDKYIRIAWNNILEDKKQFFNKFDAKFVTDFGVGYDYESVLHYSLGAFSKNGQNTIIPLKDTKGVKIGQRQYLTKKDIRKLNLMYKC